MHLGRVRQEGRYYLPVGNSAMGSSSTVIRVGGRDISSLPSNPVRIPEVRQACVLGVQREALEKHR
jgi:hypothetical protein